PPDGRRLRHRADRGEDVLLRAERQAHHPGRDPAAEPPQSSARRGLRGTRRTDLSHGRHEPPRPGNKHGYRARAATDPVDRRRTRIAPRGLVNVTPTPETMSATKLFRPRNKFCQFTVLALPRRRRAGRIPGPPSPFRHDFTSSPAAVRSTRTCR